MRTVLIIEDEADLRGLMTAELTQGGYDVWTAADGVAALELLARGRPDVIVCDVIMPRMDGNQFLKELRKTGEGRQVGFIILTARGGMRDYFEVVGVDGFIEKPFRAGELVRKIEDVAARKAGGGGFASGKADIPGLRKGALSNIRVSDGMEAVLKSGMGDVEASSPGSLPPEPRSAPQPYGQAGPEAHGTQRKILIMESDPYVCHKLEFLLQKKGHLTWTTAQAGDLEKQAELFQPQVILLRERFEGGTAAQNLAVSLKSHPSFSRVPIFIYGHIGERVDRALETGTVQSDFILNTQGHDLLNKIEYVLKTL